MAENPTQCIATGQFDHSNLYMGSGYFLTIRNKPGNETQKSYVKKQRREPLIANADEIIWNQLGKTGRSEGAFIS